MAHFAQLDNNNLVTNVIVINNDDIKDINSAEVESIGVALCQKLFGASTNWKQTSYNNNIRGNYAGIGYTYMTGVRTLGVASTDIFIEQQPYASWAVGVNTANWFCPLGNSPAVGVGSTGWYDWDEAAYQADTGSPKTVGWAYTTTR